MKRPGLLISVPFAILLSTALSVNAADPDLSKYPLRIKVLYSESGNQTDEDTNIVFFNGAGEANLLSSPGAQAIDFQYADCQDRVELLNAGPHKYIAARWKKPGKELEVLLPHSEPGKPFNPNKASYTKCTFKVVTHDFVFVPGKPATVNTPAKTPAPEDDDMVTLSGRQIAPPESTARNARAHTLATMSLQDYAKDPSLQALIEGDATPKQPPTPAQPTTK